ncbi:hypothetical protein ACGFW5_25005 [Streptomyces sp. NPDC048416]|uniref:hypothetical protein n=1 Tax=Streptomyces sp. NPDC048416 TaxID=3365546 RepID=UPI00371B6C70
MTATTRIDVHAHFLPDAYLKAAADAGLSSFDGGIPIPSWSPDAAREFMDRQGVSAGALGPFTHCPPPRQSRRSTGPGP